MIASTEQKEQIRISVRTLVEYSLRSGDLVSEFTFSSSDRAMEGNRAHQKIQQSRPKVYQPEVPVSYEVETEEFSVKIGGRIDGIYRYPDRIVIDEIKSCTRPPESYEEDENPIHWGQVKTYAYIYATQHELLSIATQLTYINSETGKIKEYTHTFTIEELEVFFNELLSRYLHWAATLITYQRLRDESIKSLTFPFGSYRPGQRKMALHVYRAIEQAEQLIVEAPTGIGKTMAAIFPAVKALGNGLTEKFFYLTAKTTGRQVAQKALEDLAAGGLFLKSLTLTAKEKICLSPGSACNGEECGFARGYFDRINEAVETIFQNNALTRERVTTVAELFSVCPFELSLELSLWVDCIICDYNYVFDPRIYLKRFFGEEDEEKNFTFLVDEANNMVDRSREMFSAALFKQSVMELRRLVKTELPQVYKSLGAINSRLVKFKKECDEVGKPLALEEYPDDLSPLLRRFVNAAEHWLQKNSRTSFRQEVLELYFEINWFLKVAENFSETYAFCIETVDENFRVKLFCLDPSLPLSEALKRCRSVTFFSATLSPVDYFRQILGCNPSAPVLILPSPFPAENLCLVVADRVSTLYKYRESTKNMVASTIDMLVKQHSGNYLVFFPSYQYMKMIYGLFAEMNPLIEHIVQTPGMTEGQRDEFLENFCMDNREQGKTLVGFAVMGGVFGEGIDLVGDRLTGAVIVGVGLPGISLERELIKDYYERSQESGFEYAYMYPGMNRVFQAAGRVIRSDTDRGVVLLIDSRFSTARYRELFPYHWSPVRLRDEEHLTKILETFWKTTS